MICGSAFCALLFATTIASCCKLPPDPGAAEGGSPTASAEPTATSTPSTAEVCDEAKSHKRTQSEGCQNCVENATDGRCSRYNEKLLACVGGDKAYGQCAGACVNACMGNEGACCVCLADCFGKQKQTCVSKYLEFERCSLKACESKCK